MGRISEMHKTWMKEPTYRKAFEVLEEECVLTSAVIDARTRRADPIRVARGEEVGGITVTAPDNLGRSFLLQPRAKCFRKAIGSWAEDSAGAVCRISKTSIRTSPSAGRS